MSSFITLALSPLAKSELTNWVVKVAMSCLCLQSTVLQAGCQAPRTLDLSPALSYLPSPGKQLEFFQEKLQQNKDGMSYFKISYAEFI